MNRDPLNKEGQKNPIFLLQRRDYVLTHRPLWLAHGDEHFWIDYQHLDGVDTSEWNFIDKGEIDERKLFEYLCEYTDDDAPAAIKQWITESVWLTREEATRFAVATAHNFQYGWRVYCLSAAGELAQILNAADVGTLA